jgi:predicted enzyme related to lactoylglutathione lyase
MITGVHALVYSKAADDARSFFKDVLGLESVDAGRGWLIFAAPPMELAVHPTEEEPHHELYLMCDDVAATVEELKGKGVEFARGISDQGWGLVTSIRMPGGGELGLYQPKHPTAIPQAR